MNYIIAYFGIGLVWAILTTTVSAFRGDLDKLSHGATGLAFLLTWFLWPLEIAVKIIWVICTLLGLLIKH